jgi:hypothetical protein
MHAALKYMNRIGGWLVKRRWIVQSIVGFMWLYLAVAALGKGQEFAVYLAFLGMLFWAIKEDESASLKTMLDDALDGWKKTIDLVERTGK